MKESRPHPDPDAHISDEELEAATETAFLQVQAVQGPDGPSDLAKDTMVCYRSPSGVVEPGPLKVISADARTALIEGYMDEPRRYLQLRVMRSELVPDGFVTAIARRILADAHPCPNCSVLHRPASLPKLTGESKNLMN